MYSMPGVTKTIAVLRGDGIGPEVTGAAIQILEDCAKSFEHKFIFRELAFGGAAIDQFGVPLPDETREGCRSADAILLGAIGGPKWDALPLEKRPEAGLLKIRKELGLYINLRPIRLRPALRGISPLRRERIADCDFEIIRELSGDIYFGAHEIHGTGNSASARDVAEYSVAEIERVTRWAFERAEARNRRLASVDKANVLATSRLWRDTVTRIAADYPHVVVEHLYVDNAAMQLLLKPSQFDVILTGNLFGDILSDEAAALAGSIGLIPSMSRGRDGLPALYEPIHGSAPSLAGKDIACPLGAIFSAVLMLRESFGLELEAQWIEAAVDHVLDHGFRTIDITEPSARVLTASEFTSHIRAELHDALVHSERYGWGV
jgi:3-isopropylmalate dehydrogenase